MTVPFKYLSTKEAARILGTALITVQKYCQSGKLKAVKVGRDWLIDPKSLDNIKREVSHE